VSVSDCIALCFSVMVLRWKSTFWTSLTQKQSNSLTRDGRNWLVAALDPFHDSEVVLAGLPDRLTDGTVVQKITKSFNVSAPAGTVGSWTAHVFTLPDLQRSALAAFDNVAGTFTTFGHTDSVGPTAGPITNVTNCFDASSAKNLTLGTCNCIAWPTDVATATDALYPNGTQLLTTWTTNAPVATSVSPLDGIEADPISRMRVISAGFEVVNTTPALYRSGLCTVSRLPSTRRSVPIPSVYHAGVISCSDFGASMCGTLSPCSFTCCSGPPSSISEALSYSGSRQWDASRGCYCVERFNHDENDLNLVFRQQVAFANTWGERDISGATEIQPIGYCTVSQAFSGNTSLGQSGFLSSVRSSFGLSVPKTVSSAILSGLSLQTTFTVTYVAYLEIAPHLRDPRFGQLTYSVTPSADFDEKALIIYEEIMQRMPAGVPQDQNPDGEFWEGVKDIAESFGIPRAMMDAGGRVFDYFMGPKAAAAATAARSAAPASIQLPAGSGRVIYSTGRSSKPPPKRARRAPANQSQRKKPKK